MSWARSVLEDLVFFQRGFDITKNAQKPGDIPVVSSSGINSYHSEYKVKGPGVVIGRKGSLGTVHYVEGNYWPHDTTLWSKDLKGNNPRFVAYFIETLNLERLDVGNSNPTLNRNHIHKIEVEIPPLQTQNKIASILSAYDELIENNRRRIALLEESARLLYREWFVHLRFPGHEHTTIVDGVPEGWGKVTFSEKADFLNGFAFKPKHQFEEGIPIVKIPELRSGPTQKTPRNPGDMIPERFHLQDGDILFSWSGTLLVNIWNSGKGLLNQHLFKVTPKDKKDYFLLYLSLKQALDQFQNRTVGSTMKHIRKKELEAVSFLYPKDVLLFDFNEFIRPILGQIQNLQKSNNQLKKSRDLLLPKLMSGEIPV